MLRLLGVFIYDTCIYLKYCYIMLTKLFDVSFEILSSMILFILRYLFYGYIV